MKRWKTLFVVLLAMALFAASCGGSDDSEADEAEDDTEQEQAQEEPEEIPTEIDEEVPDEEPEEEDSGEAVSGGTLVIASQVDAAHFNGNIASGSPTGQMSSQLFASPVRFDENYQPQPYLAESWEFSDDGLDLHIEPP